MAVGPPGLRGWLRAHLGGAVGALGGGGGVIDGVLNLGAGGGW